MRAASRPVWRAGVLLALCACGTQVSTSATRAHGTEEATILGDEVGSFIFRDERGNAMRPIRVWYFRPVQLAPTTRIVFLMHGSSRTGRQARDLGMEYARARGLILLAPEFSEDHYPGRRMYDFGNMMDSNGRMLPEREWTLLTIEHLFDLIRGQAKLTTPTYDIVGHSSGGQFVHRLVLFVPSARFRRAIASTPGRYALPVHSVHFPYGLEGTGVDSAALAGAFARDLVLLLGDEDTEEQLIQEEETIDPAHARDAMAQGRNRLARGLRFFAVATEVANSLGVPLGWRLRLAHGVDHDPHGMVRAAFEELFP